VSVVSGLPEGIAGKALALGICVVLLAIFYLVAVAPLVVVYGDGQQELQERQDMAERLQGTVRDLPRLRALAAQWQQKSSVNDLLLPASSDAVATASLQSTVKALVTQGGSTLTTTEILPSQTEDNLHRVGIHVAFNANLPLLTAVLRGIETAHPRLFVDNLDIHGEGKAGADAADPRLAVAFDVYGFPTP